MRSILLAAVLLATNAQVAFSSCTERCIGPEWLRKCACVEDINVHLPDPTKLNPTDIAKAALPGLAPAVEAAKRSGDPNLVAATQNFEALGAKLDKETQTAIANALTNPAQGVKDAVQTHLKAANDIVDAVHASARYAEREVSGYGDVLSKADRRVREGKVVDAMWNLGTDTLKTDNENAAKLMQESELVRQTAQAVANAYGGPAGTAAFAAWMAYNQTQNIEAALRAGVYTYAVSEGYAKVNAMPSGKVNELAAKAAATAAVRGLAVAAAGGSKGDILNAAAQGGGSVLVQSGQAYVTKEYVEPTKARADAFCMDALKTSCADARQWVTDSRNRLQQYSAAADALPDTVITDDGRWAISWDKAALFNRNSRAPSVVLTYLGPGSPFEEQMRLIRVGAEPGKVTPPFTSYLLR